MPSRFLELRRAGGLNAESAKQPSQPCHLPATDTTMDDATVADDSADANNGPLADTGGIRRGALTYGLNAGAALLLIPIALYFSFVHRYGVNAIYYDQWDNVALLTHTQFLAHNYSHTTVSALWTQHNEDRLFFPNLIVLALDRLTNFNVLTELYLSAALLVIALALIILAHRQDVARARLVFYLPVAFLVLTLAQYEDTLFGFNIQLYVVLVMLAATIFLLVLQRSSWLILVAAIATAVVGTYSGLEGLAIWPTGLVVLLWKRRPRAFALAWSSSAVATTALYFYHYNFSASGSRGGDSYVLSHPLLGAKFFFFAIGDLTGGALPYSFVGRQYSDPAILTIGVAVFLLALLCLAIAFYGGRRSPSRSPVGPALICFGLLLVIVVTIGRVNLGLALGASRSRYVPDDLLILVGCYLCLLERWPGHEEESVVASLSAAISAADGFPRNATPPLPTIRDQWRQVLLVGIRCIAILLIVVEVSAGIDNGISAGAASRKMYQHANLVTAHAACAPDSLIKRALFPNAAYAYSNVRALAVAAKKDHLSFFATSEGSMYEHMKLPHESDLQPQIRLLDPTDGALVRGNVLLIAAVSANCPIKAVNFDISGSGDQRQVLPAQRFKYGWYRYWSTTDVSNGLYTVQGTARNIGGYARTTRPVHVTVQN